MFKQKGYFLALAVLATTCAVPAAAQQAQPQAAQALMAEWAAMYSPELKKKMMAVAPETRMQLMSIMVTHDRRSPQATMRQVMQEIMADFQTVSIALATDNGEMAADAARRLANHRLPKGGMLPYLPWDKITTQDISTLPTFNMVVEGGALKVAAAAEKGDFATAAQHFGEVMSGCVACHQQFRGVPGVSDRFVAAPAK